MVQNYFRFLVTLIVVGGNEQRRCFVLKFQGFLPPSWRFEKSASPVVLAEFRANFSGGGVLDSDVVFCEIFPSKFGPCDFPLSPADKPNESTGIIPQHTTDRVLRDPPQAPGLPETETTPAAEYSAIKGEDALWQINHCAPVLTSSHCPP